MCITCRASCLQEEIIHEAQLMKKYNHPNILPLHCSFVHGEDLWMVMPFIAGGSVLHIMKYAHPEVCSGCASSCYAALCS
jgi:serine/threonine-protein kinase OSR1/STK39